MEHSFSFYDITVQVQNRLWTFCKWLKKIHENAARNCRNPSFHEKHKDCSKHLALEGIYELSQQL